MARKRPRLTAQLRTCLNALTEVAGDTQTPSLLRIVAAAMVSQIAKGKPVNPNLLSAIIKAGKLELDSAASVSNSKPKQFTGDDLVPANYGFSKSTTRQEVLARVRGEGK